MAFNKDALAYSLQLLRSMNFAKDQAQTIMRDFAEEKPHPGLKLHPYQRAAVDRFKEAERRVLGVDFAKEEARTTVYWMGQHGLCKTDGTGKPALVSYRWGRDYRNGTWTSEPFNASNIPRTKMKPGPYKSTTHGPINVSMKARELLAENRSAVTALVASGMSWSDTNYNGHAVSHSRGEIAKYIGELEEKCGVIKAEELRVAYGGTTAKSPYQRAEEAMIWLCKAGERAGVDHTLNKYGVHSLKELAATVRTFTMRQLATELEAQVKRVQEKLKPGATCVMIDDPYADMLQKRMNTVPEWVNELTLNRYRKEIPVTNQKDTEQTTPAEKSRSQLLGEATNELVQAQHELELMTTKGDAPTPERLYVSAGSNGYINSAVSTLVREQWESLVKKAVARAKARVAKAEKAVAALLGS